jgi:hypothetical protein
VRGPATTHRRSLSARLQGFRRFFSCSANIMFDSFSFVIAVSVYCRAARRRRVNEDPHAATQSRALSLSPLCVRSLTTSDNDARTPLALFFHLCTLYLCAHRAATIALPVVRCLRQQHFRSPLALICPFECHFSITPLNHVQKKTNAFDALSECTALFCQNRPW